MGSERSGGSRGRASSPIIGDVLMVGVAVLVATVVVVFTLDAFAGLPTGTPVVSASADPYVVGPSDRCGVNEVTLRHESGHVVAVDALALVVTLPDAGSGSARLRGFPVESGRLDDSNVEGDASIVSRECVGGALTDGDGTWAAGSPLTVQLNGSAVEPGDRIRVRVVHEPTNTNVTEKRLVAETS